MSTTTLDDPHAMRAAWFAEQGYPEVVDATPVVLRGKLGKSLVKFVWDVRIALLNMNNEHPSLFTELAQAAWCDTLPEDPERLCAYNLVCGNAELIRYKPGRLNVIQALVNVRRGQATLVDEPLKRPKA